MDREPRRIHRHGRPVRCHAVPVCLPQRYTLTNGRSDSGERRNAATASRLDRNTLLSHRFPAIVGHPYSSHSPHASPSTGSGCAGPSPVGTSPGTGPVCATASRSPSDRGADPSHTDSGKRIQYAHR